MMTDAESLCTTVISNFEDNVNPTMAKLFRFMGLGTVEDRARGLYIYDVHGRQYLDCLGGYGVFNLGHSHPKVIKAVQKQLNKMPLSSKVLFNEAQGRLAARLAEITPGGLQYSFFCNSGAEAVEGALKLARLATGRSKIIAARNSFHGKTLGALSATGREVFRKPCEPLLPGFTHVPFNNAEAIAQVCSPQTAAVILEPIQGEGGIILPSPDYLGAVRKICDHHGALLILDEVQTGMGRTGRMFACEHYRIAPDILTLAKALGGGVMPIGAFVATLEVWETLVANPFLHTSTFGGNPLACTAGLAALDVLQEEGLIEAADHLGKYFLSGLRNLQQRYPEIIREARGLGLLLGIELESEGFGGQIMSEMFNAGILVAYTLNNPRVIRLEPPLVITMSEIDRVLAALDQSAAKTRENLTRENLT